jgi:hypothetical protein
MARFYFDLVHDWGNLRDEEGDAYDDLDAAVRSAARSASEIGRIRLSKGDFTDVVIDVRDERDQRVVTVTSSVKLIRHDTPPDEQNAEFPKDHTSSS